MTGRRSFGEASIRPSRIEGRRSAIALTATVGERKVVADRLDLLSLGTLEARLTVNRRPKERLLEVSGTLTADVVQGCVVTGDPLALRIETTIDERFLEQAGRESDEIVIDPLGDDPEPLEDDVLDLGELVTQTLSLALDPYPRGPDADAAAIALTTSAPAPEQNESPFAGLADLKDSTAKKS